MNKYIICTIVIAKILLSSCNHKKKSCTPGVYKDLEIAPVHVILKIPPFRILDSVIYDSQRTLLNYRIKTLDSSMDVILFVNDYEDYGAGQRNIEKVMMFQKKEAESFLESSIKLITERYKQIDGIKVGYVKYFIEQKDRKFYSSRIFFYKDKKLVTIWLFEKYVNEARNSYSVIDCIRDSIKFR